MSHIRPIDPGGVCRNCYYGKQALCDVTKGVDAWSTSVVTVFTQTFLQRFSKQSLRIRFSAT